MVFMLCVLFLAFCFVVQEALYRFVNFNNVIITRTRTAEQQQQQQRRRQQQQQQHQ